MKSGCRLRLCHVAYNMWLRLTQSKIPDRVTVGFIKVKYFTLFLSASCCPPKSYNITDFGVGPTIDSVFNTRPSIVLYIPNLIW